MSNFDPQPFVEALCQGPNMLAELLRSIPEKKRRTRPRPEKWSPLEILVHLYDEEREDFRQRLRLTLEDPSQPWPPIDPEGWVIERHYVERDFDAVLEEWCEERRASLLWLAGLTDADWGAVHTHPVLGELRAGDLLCAWAAHDHLHAAQVLRTRWTLLEPACAPFSAHYSMP